MQSFCSKYGILKATFPQCALGQLFRAKWTTLAFKHAGRLRKLHGPTCTHQGHTKRTKASSDLARWAPGLSEPIAKSIIRALPVLEHWTNNRDSDRALDNVATSSV